MREFRVVLVEPHISGNIGFVARSMKNFDLSDLFLVDPHTEIDNASYAHAMHADDVLKKAKIVKTIDDATCDCDFVVGTTAVISNEYNVTRTSLTPKDFSKRIQEIEGKIAIVFGRESSGLTLDELNLMDLVVTVPTSKEYQPLNISHAAAIIFYELYSCNKAHNLRVADKAEKNVLFDYMKQIIEVLEEFKDYRREKGFKVFKNVINRSFVSAMEAHKLAGIFRSIYKNLLKGR